MLIMSVVLYACADEVVTRFDSRRFVLPVAF